MHNNPTRVFRVVLCDLLPSQAHLCDVVAAEVLSVSLNSCKRDKWDSFCGFNRTKRQVEIERSNCNPKICLSLVDTSSGGSRSRLVVFYDDEKLAMELFRQSELWCFSGKWHASFFPVHKNLKKKLLNLTQFLDIYWSLRIMSILLFLFSGFCLYLGNNSETLFPTDFGMRGGWGAEKSRPNHKVSIGINLLTQTKF